MVATDSFAVQGGTPASAEAPWAVKIAADNNLCTGSVITEYWVLTARHCLYREDGSFIASDKITVRVNGRVIGLAANGVRIMSNNAEPDLAKDVALLRLSTSAKPLLAKPLPLAPTTAVIDAFVYRGVTFFGFGGTSGNDVQKTPDHSFIRAPFCPTGANLACFVQRGSAEVVPGDSGGPWVGWEGGGWVQIAVHHGSVSAGFNNLETGPSTGTSLVRGWITSVVNGDSAVALIGPPVGRILRNPQTRAAWLVGLDGFRRWIPTGAIYNCLVDADPTRVEQRDQFDIEVVPDRVGSPATCTTPPPPTGDPRRVTLAQGPAARSGYRYAVTLSGFAANRAVTVTCHDSVSPGGFYTFAMFTNGSGSASTASQCYSGDGPDHWVIAGGVESNHVRWGGGSLPPPSGGGPPSGGYPETTGGAARTWTNYRNAGGTEGPTIPAFTTVQIACKVMGFRVANGNPWWYRIAQSPWNNQYYVSADAFYNNGATSGSLRGTPWVDTKVPDCSSTVPPPPPPPTNTAPVIVSVSGAAGVVGAANPVLQIAYQDAQCNVNAGTWEGNTGSGLSVDFVPSGNCSNGVGVTTFERTCNWSGTWTEYITLKDAGGAQSQRFSFTFTCTDNPTPPTNTAPGLSAQSSTSGYVGGKNAVIGIAYVDAECNVNRGTWEDDATGLTVNFPVSGGCSAGVGTTSFELVCTSAGTFSGYVTLWDTGGLQSQRDQWSYTCYPPSGSPPSSS